ncbi:MAG: hypothetical protein GVY36_05810 [Verrucomicrobia bacterium]|jgi:nitrogen regulatory protein PII|nr:hypothetical protein [Verrucomicrobiota bacterium]
MFHQALKLVIIVEHFVIEDVCRIIESHHTKGYTLVRAGGKGRHHFHATSDRATVVEGFDNLKIEVVMHDRGVAEAIARDVLKECFEDYSGVMYLENVEVCRPELF